MVCCKFKSLPQSSRFACSSATLGLVCGIYRVGMKIVGPAMFLFAELFILSIAIIFLFVFYPELYLRSTLLCLFHTTVGIYLIINIVFNHFACAFTPPGSPPYCPDPGRLLGEKLSIIDGRKIYQMSYHLNVAPNVSYRYCHTCKCIKPPRAHHCR